MIKKSVGIAMLFASCPLYGCSVHGRLPTTQGYIQVEGDAKGVAAFMDGFNGAITNGKASPDKDTASWQHRKAQEKQITLRETQPGILDGLFGVGAPAEKE